MQCKNSHSLTAVDGWVKVPHSEAYISDPVDDSSGTTVYMY